ncbi:MAG: hypothetical protein ACE5DI_01305 [Candidatus Micrarchaeia archaeon]
MGVQDRIEAALTRKETKISLGFTLLAVIASYFFLTYLNTLNPADLYSSVNFPFIILVLIGLVATWLGGRKIPLRVFTFGDPQDKVAGLPRPFFSALAGGATFFFLGYLRILKPFSVIAPLEDELFVLITFGSGLVEELVFTGFIFPTLAILMWSLGLIPALLLFSFFAFVGFIPLNFFFLFIIVGGLLYVLQTKKPDLAVNKNWVLAILAAMVFTGLLFVSSHERVNIGSFDRATAEFTFSVVAVSLALLTGSIAGSVVLHVANNSLAYYCEEALKAKLPCTPPELWWLPIGLVFILIFIYSFLVKKWAVPRGVSS